MKFHNSYFEEYSTLLLHLIYRLWWKHRETYSILSIIRDNGGRGGWMDEESADNPTIYAIHTRVVLETRQKSNCKSATRVKRGGLVYVADAPVHRSRN